MEDMANQSNPPAGEKCAECVTMKYFSDTIIKPFIIDRRYRKLCEIGASVGGNTDKLLETNPLSVTIIDPCLDSNLENKHRSNRNVFVRKGLSLEVLPKLTDQFDSIFIDGDHNWYTAFNELRLIEDRNLLRNGGAIFLHDVGWPYGRRDMYYQPETIPPEFLRPNAKKGLIFGQSELSDTDGINKGFCNALDEGGSRNGVLAGVEDFIKLYPRTYQFLSSQCEFGLGLLYKGGFFGKLRMVKWARRIKSLQGWYSSEIARGFRSE
jgi:hypothetical protein